MSLSYFYSKATCDDLSTLTWNFDPVEQPGGPFCVTDTDIPEFVDGDIPLVLDGQQVSLQPQYVPGTAILEVSSFDSTSVIGPSFDPDSGCCVAGLQNVPCQVLQNEMCPTEPEQMLANVIRVTVTGAGSGDGSSWANASTLESALFTSGTDLELWLQTGDYTNSNTPYRFQVPDSFRLYGGFVGTETSRAQRPVNTILSGGTVLDGGTAAGVVQITPNISGLTVFDGLVFRDGSATNGAGILLNHNAQLVVRNCAFRGNNATEGGAIFADNGATVTLCDSFFTNNTANSSVAGGGAVLNAFQIDSLQCFNCVMLDNSSDTAAGCFAVETASNALFINCAFANTTSVNVAAVTLGNVTSASFLQCTFSQQTSTGGFGGGAIFVSNSVVDVRNSIFWANSGTLRADAVVFGATSTVNICDYMASDTDVNSFFASGTSTLNLTNRVGGPGGVDPLFVDQMAGDLRLTAPSIARDSGDNNGLLFRNCANSVPVGVTINVDLDSFARVFTDTVDLGPYEFKTEKWQFFDGTKSLLPIAMCPEPGEPAAENIIYVKVVATGAGNGSSWADAADLTTALSIAQDDQELWLQSGTYTSTATPSRFTINNRIAIYGGFDGTETQRSQRNSDPATNGTVVDGTGQRCFQNTLFDPTDTSTLDGLSVINGSSSVVGGGAVFFNNRNLVVRNCNFSNNTTSSGAGGAILVRSAIAGLVLCNCTFSNNSASSRGGAGSVENCGVARMFNCSFITNIVTNGSGSAVNLSTLSLESLFINCLAYGNDSSANGAGTFQLQAVPKSSFLQCTMVNNTGRFGAGAIDLRISGVCNVRNTIFYGNVSINNVGDDAIVFPGITLNVCDYMASNSNAVSFSNQGGTINLSNRIGADTTPGVDPLFVDQANGDLRLQKASIARDSGDNLGLEWRDCANTDLVDVDINVDLQRIQRIVNTTVDLGAYEWAPDVDCFEVLLSWDGTGPQPCVHGDTLLTVKERGLVPIKDVRAGDLVLARRSLNEEPQYVKVSFNVAIHVPKTRFVKFPTGSLGENSPNDTLLVRNGHPMLTADGAEKFSQDFVDGKTIVWLDDNEVRKVYTLATEDWTFVDMNGALVKTWDAAEFDDYAKNDECGKRLFFTKQ